MISGLVDASLFSERISPPARSIPVAGALILLWRLDRLSDGDEKATASAWPSAEGVRSHAHDPGHPMRRTDEDL
jgi:hypothetical protein